VFYASKYEKSNPLYSFIFEIVVNNGTERVLRKPVGGEGGQLVNKADFGLQPLNLQV
jgi:hypothetical protein